MASYNRGCKDMSYALFSGPERQYHFWAERNPGYGAGAVEAANERLKERHGGDKTVQDYEITEIDERLAKVREAKAAAKAAFHEAVAKEKALVERQAKLKAKKSAEKKATNADEAKNELARRKAEKLARRERALGLKKTTGVAAAHRPAGVKKVQAVEKRKTVARRLTEKFLEE